MVLLSLGSNLSSKYGNRFQNIDLAISLLESYNVTVKKKSSYFESLSYPNKKNPKFINVMISIVTNLPPVDLASVILFIEDKIERKRDKKNDPRTCDIDIIDYNKKKKRKEWIRVKLLRDAKNELILEKYYRDGAGILSSTVFADGLMEVEENTMNLKTGDLVNFIPFNELMR